MKTLNYQMQAELTGSDLLAAILGSTDTEAVLKSIMEMPGVLSTYVKTHRNDVTKAVTQFMSNEHKLQAEKVIYQGERILVEARTPGAAFKAGREAVAKREASEGHRKNNMKIFQFLREYFTDERRAGRKDLQFETVLKDVQFFYPKITARLLQIYLHDKRQLKGVDFKAKRGTVILK